MKSMNQVTLLGNVGQDPEVRSTGGGTLVANVALATNDYAGKNADGTTKELTNWHRVTLWGRLAEVVQQYVKRGDRLLVTGEIRYSTYKDPSGADRWSTDIHAKDVVLLGSREAAVGASASRVPLDLPEDNLPF
jgi:single-strand DNA-binding protein